MTITFSQLLANLAPGTAADAGGAAKLPMLGGAGALGLPTQSLIQRFSGVIDPHLPPYNAKGDAATGKDAVTYGTNEMGVGNSYVFSDADVGKLIWIDSFAQSGARTIVSVDTVTNRCTFTGGTVGSGSNRWYLLGTDDTAALQAALDDCATNPLHSGMSVGDIGNGARSGNHGRVVVLHTGRQYIVSNSQASFTGGKGYCLRLPKRGGLIGAGGHARSSMLQLAPNSWGNVIDIAPDSFTDVIALANFAICGNRWTSSGENTGIYLDWAFDGYYYVDPFCYIYNVDVFDIRQGDGFYLNGRGQTVVAFCRAMQCNKNGFFIDGLVDSSFTTCDAGGCGFAGFRVRGAPNNRFVNCKSFYNGSSGGSDPRYTCNWWLDGDNQRKGICQYHGCEAQESRGSGWYIEQGMNLISGCTGFDPGRDGLNSGTIPTVAAGFHLADSVHCANNVFVDCMVQPTVPVWSSSNWGKATNAVHIGAAANNNKGRIWTWPEISYSPGYGPVGGTGASNGNNIRISVDGTALT